MSTPLTEEIDRLRARVAELEARIEQAQARLATKRELLERLRFLCTDLIPDETAEEVRGSTEVDDIISCLIDTTAAPVPPAEAKAADDVVRHIAEIVHNGGLRGIDPYNAIRLIRLLTLDVWDKSGTIDDLKDRVDAAMLAAKAKRE